MTKQLLGQAFMQPYEEATRAQSNRAMTQNREMRTQMMPQQIAQRQNYQNARIQNMQQRIQQMQGTLKLNRDRFNESVRQFNELLPYREKQMSMGGRQPALIQEMNDIMATAQQYGAYDEKTGNILMDKLPADAKQRINYELLDVQKKSAGMQNINRIRQMENVLATAKGQDISSLQHYSGLRGNAKLKADMGQYHLTGHAPKQLTDYLYLVNTVIPTLADQMGQAFGASVQPVAAAERQRATANPKSYVSNPDLIKKSWEGLVGGNGVAAKELQIARAQAGNPQFNLAGDQSLGVNFLQSSASTIPSASASAPAATSGDIKTTKGNTVSEEDIKQFAQAKGMSESQATAFIMSNY